jgi:Flp pilus assembly protein TadD
LEYSLLGACGLVDHSNNLQLPATPESMNCKIWPPIALFLLLSLTTLSAFAGDASWLEVRTEHFRVITDAGEKYGREVASHFEQMRAAFGVIFGREKINDTVPLQIVAFRNTKEFRQYSPIFRGKVVELAGFAIPAQDENFVAIDMSLANSWETVMHEYAHVLLNANYTPTAPWFDEGFAEFFSSIKIQNAEVQIGGNIPETVALFQGQKLNMQELLEVQHHSETYNQSGQRRDMFYVESWLFVHYLFDTRQITRASQYFTLTNNKQVPVPQAIQAAFGISVNQLNDALLDYFRKGKIQVIRYKFSQQIAAASQVTVRPLDQLDARTQLADMHLHEEDYQAQAVKELEGITTENPKQVEAQRALGYAYLEERNFPKATEHLQAAAKLGSKDPRVYFFTAELLNDQNPAAIGTPDVAENLRRAIELDPQYADAYAMLGVSLMNTGSYAQAESNLARAIALSPRNEVYRLNYAFSLLNQQKITEAKTALSYIAHSSNAEVATQANQLLQQVKEYEAHTTPGATASTASTASHLNGPSSPAGIELASEPSPPVAAVQMSYIKGVLVAVDCSAPPAALLTVTSGGKTWKLQIANSDKLVLIGADKFSCSWSHKNVALNFSPTSADEGRVVSLEIQ